MPRAYPEEFRQRAVELARQREQSISQIAADLGIAQSALHRWVRQADIDEGQRDGLTTEERAELVSLRRANRVSASPQGHRNASRPHRRARARLPSSWSSVFVVLSRPGVMICYRRCLTSA